ncbi:MAG: helix-turn-helix domain-containing protein [Coprobacillaceae bacterium]
MEIGKKLRTARINSGLTQEQIAEDINVSRQTISNWENEKSYPDIISVIKLSDLYHISLDELLKGDDKLIEHLDESTNIVSSNKKLILTAILNIVIVIGLFFCNTLFPNKYLLFITMSIAVISTTTLFYQIIRKF